jgi:hypothetical protein
VTHQQDVGSQLSDSASFQQGSATFFEVLTVDLHVESSKLVGSQPVVRFEVEDIADSLVETTLRHKMVELSLDSCSRTPTVLMWPHTNMDWFLVIKCAKSTRAGRALGIPDKTKIWGL